MPEIRRTVVVSGVPNVLKLRMVDKLTIHFQCRRRSHGGDVEVVEYPTNMDGVAFVTFDRAEDAERVVKKEEQIMKDEEFPQDYALTVFPFSEDVFLYVSNATVDLSAFGSDQAFLIKSLQSVHRSIRFQALPLQMKASVEGPFSAVSALRKDLFRRAKCLKPSPQAVVKPRESSPNRRPASENSPTSCRGAKAKQETANSSSLSKPPQRTGGAREAQSPISKGKSPKASPRQRASNENLAGGSLRRLAEEEIRAGIMSSSTHMRLPAEETSTKQQRDDSCSRQPSRSDRFPANQSGAGYWEDPGSKFPQNDLRKASTLSTKNAEASKDIWVDLHTFKYIEKFQKKELIKCLKGVDMTTQGIDGMMWILLSENQASGASSRTLKDALEKLETLILYWQSELRVNEIFYSKAKLLDKQKLIQICNEAASLWNDVLYLFEDSCIKVIGPSVTSHLFCRMVEDSIDKSITVNPIIGKSSR